MYVCLKVTHILFRLYTDYPDNISAMKIARLLAMLMFSHILYYFT